MTFGLKGRYTAYLKTRKYAVEVWLASRRSEQALALARSKGVEVLDMGAVVDSERPKELNVNQVPLPY